MVNQFINEIINYIDNKNHFYNNLSDNAYYDVLHIINMKQKDSINSSEQFVKLRDHTIDILINIGVKDLPMMERTGHIRDNILSSEEVEQLGYSSKHKHNHGLGIMTYLRIIDSMDNNDSRVFQYIKEPNHYIIETPIRISEVKSIVPITIEQKGRYNNTNIELNKIMTVFTPNCTYIYDLLNKGKIKEMVTQANAEQAPLTTNNISNNNIDVKHVFDEILLLLSIV